MPPSLVLKGSLKADFSKICTKETAMKFYGLPVIDDEGKLIGRVIAAKPVNEGYGHFNRDMSNCTCVQITMEVS